jgi:hypothetical protein
VFRSLAPIVVLRTSCEARANSDGGVAYVRFRNPSRSYADDVDRPLRRDGRSILTHQRARSANCGRSALRSIAAIGRACQPTADVRAIQGESLTASPYDMLRALLAASKPRRTQAPDTAAYCYRRAMHRTRIRSSYRFAAEPAFRLRARSEPAAMLNARWGVRKQTKQKSPPGEVLLPHPPTRVNCNPSFTETLLYDLPSGRT